MPAVEPQPASFGGTESRIPAIPRQFRRAVASGVQPEPSADVVSRAAPGEPVSRGPASLYGRLSDEALGSQYRALIEKRNAESEGAVAPLWDEQREARAVDQIENRRRADGSLAPADQRRLATLQLQQGEGYGIGRHTFESAAAERRVNEYTRHLTAIEREMANRGLNPNALALPHETAPIGFEEENPFPPEDIAQHTVSEPAYEPTGSRALPAGDDLPHGTPTGEALSPNRAKFSQAPDIQRQLGEAIDAASARGVGRTVVPIAEGLERARSFAEDIGADPLQIDPKKVGRLSGEEIVGMRSAAQQHMTQITEWSKQLANPDLPIEQRTQLDYLIRDAKGARDNLIEAVSRAASQKGRDLNFLKQLAQHSLDPDVWEANAKSLAGDRVLSDDVIAETRRLAQAAFEACS